MNVIKESQKHKLSVIVLFRVNTTINPTWSAVIKPQIKIPFLVRTIEFQTVTANFETEDDAINNIEYIIPASKLILHSNIQGNMLPSMILDANDIDYQGVETSTDIQSLRNIDGIYDFKITGLSPEIPTMPPPTNVGYTVHAKGNVAVQILFKSW